MASKTKDGSMRKSMTLCAFALSAAMLAGVAPAALAGPQEDTEQAEKEFARGNLIVALSLWRKAADQGHAPAQARLGDMFDKSEDDKEAFEWYQKSAAQGNAAGEFGLGQMYLKGEGVAKDAEKAFLYIAKAAEKGNLQAVLLMRDVYRNGSLGQAVDLAKSAEWDKKAQEIVARETPPAATPDATAGTTAAATTAANTAAAAPDTTTKK